MIECDSCGKDIERPNLIDGLRLCAQCAFQQRMEYEPPSAPIEKTWRKFKKHEDRWK